MKSPTKKTAPVKRVKRVAFKPTYRQRCVYLFSETLLNLNDIHDELSRTKPQAGMKFVSCYKNLSGTIEMLCKATLVQKSPYLVMKKLDGFDQLFPDAKGLEGEETCGAIIALARASKLFKREFYFEHVGKLKKTIENRNACEHGEFVIEDYDTELHHIAVCIEIVANIYNSQFRAGNILEECEQYIEEEEIEIFDKVIQECSKEFKAVSKEVQALEKKKVKFMTCLSCYYDFAKISESGASYECLWCKDARNKVVCSTNGCKQTFWVKLGEEQKVKCDQCDGSKNRLFKEYYASSSPALTINYPDVLKRMSELAEQWNTMSSWSSLSDVKSLSNPKGADSDDVASEVTKDQKDSKDSKKEK